MTRRRFILAALVGIATAAIAGPALAQSLSIDMGGSPASARRCSCGRRSGDSPCPGGCSAANAFTATAERS